MDFSFKIQRIGKYPVPADVMGIDKATGRKVYIVVTRNNDGTLTGEAQKFGLKATGKNTSELLTAFEAEYNKKYHASPKPTIP